MKTLLALAVIASSLFAGSVALADTTASPLANAVRVTKPAPVKPIASTVKHLTGTKCVTRPLEQGGPGNVRACDM